MTKNLKIHLLIIDPQNDFCDIPADESPEGKASTLPVPGAHEDMKRAGALINRIGHKLEDIHVTLDSHRKVDIAHPIWWMDQNGNPPAPFTLIFSKDIRAGIWTTRHPGFLKRSLAYAEALESTGKYILCIWPPHCLISTWGANVHDSVNEALQAWSEKEFAMVDYVTKGSNPWTEHYGGMMAEVPDADDPSTSLNTEFIKMLRDADIIGILGEAGSHCVKATVDQIADNIGEEHIKKFHIITDCISPVPAVPNGPDFPAIYQEWLKAMEKRGVALTASTDFLA
ncbi:MAG: cysteine hydrolase [Candidatus Paceibacterota bacterium]